MFTLIDHDLGSPMQGVKFFEFSYFDFDAATHTTRHANHANTRHDDAYM